MPQSNIKVLLIQPPYASLRGLVPTPASHIGLLYLSAFLRHHQVKCDVIIADILSDLKPALFVFMKSYAKGWKEYKRYLTGEQPHKIWSTLLDIVKKYQPDLVGITATTPEIDSALKIASLVKGVDSRIRVVLGGPHATLMPNETMENKFVDFIIRGEGEASLLQLVRELEKEKPSLGDVPSLSYRSNDCQMFHNPMATPVIDLDTLPFPDRSSVITPPGYVLKEHSISASRGCPYRCAFCADNTLWGRVRKRTAKNVVDEIEQITSDFPKTREIYFTDGTLTFNKNFIKDLCAEIIRRNINLTFYCTVRFDNIDEDILMDMKKAGFGGLYLGAESGDIEILNNMHKGISPQMMESKMRLVKKSGIMSLVSILIGTPGESETSLKNTIALMKRLQADSFDVNCFVPLPGSEWYQNLSEHIKKNISWLDISYKGGVPYLFILENKTELYRYVRQAYQIADRRLLLTIIKTLGSKILKFTHKKSV